MHRHTEACVWKTYPSGKHACVTAKNEREKEKRKAGTLKRSGSPVRDLRQKPDGWEDEFGPVPLRSLDRDWYDQVIVVRALTRSQTGRTPYRKEWAEIIRRMDGCGVTVDEIAEATGVTKRHVHDLRRVA